MTSSKSDKNNFEENKNDSKKIIDLGFMELSNGKKVHVTMDDDCDKSQVLQALIGLKLGDMIFGDDTTNSPVKDTST